MQPYWKLSKMLRVYNTIFPLLYMLKHRIHPVPSKSVTSSITFFTMLDRCGQIWIIWCCFPFPYLALSIIHYNQPQVCGWLCWILEYSSLMKELYNYPLELSSALFQTFWCLIFFCVVDSFLLRMNKTFHLFITLMIFIDTFLDHILKMQVNNYHF